MEKQISMYLMNKKGYNVLEKFIEEFGTQPIEYVITEQDRNVEKDYYKEIHELCQRNSVKVLDRRDGPSPSSPYSFAIGWRWIINSDSKLIVFHDSLLPAYRGFAPLVNSLINKEKFLGVTALYASKEYDKGEVISQRKFEVEYPIKISEAIEEISNLYVDLVNEIARKIIDGAEISSFLQNEEQASYSLWRDEEDYKINWNEEASYIKRFIDSVGFPFKGASTTLEGHKVRILEGEVVKDVKVEIRQAGKVIFVENGCPIVVCGKGLIKLLSIKDEMLQKELIPLKKFRIKFD